VGLCAVCEGKTEIRFKIQHFLRVLTTVFKYDNEGWCSGVNKRCLTLTDEQYKESIDLLRSGFMLENKIVKPNERIATIGVLQATLGLRLGDVLKLKMISFVKDGNRYRLDIVEQKTKKTRRFTVPLEVYSFIQSYAIEHNIGAEAKLFDVSERQVQRHLNKVFTKMKLPLNKYGSHSYRRYFATNVFVNNGYNIRLVQTLLQHSSPVITQLYIGISEKAVEEALAGTVKYLI